MLIKIEKNKKMCIIVNRHVLVLRIKVAPKVREEVKE